MTPTSAVDTRVVYARVPATPEASASRMSESSTLVRAESSLPVMSMPSSVPYSAAMTKARSSPAKVVRIDFLIRSRSPRVVPSASAMFGPRSGAITIAPITAVGMSRKIPIAATIVASTTCTRKSRFSFAPPATSS